MSNMREAQGNFTPPSPTFTLNRPRTTGGVTPLVRGRCPWAPPTNHWWSSAAGSRRPSMGGVKCNPTGSFDSTTPGEGSHEPVVELRRWFVGEAPGRRPRTTGGAPPLVREPNHWWSSAAGSRAQNALIKRTWLNGEQSDDLYFSPGGSMTSPGGQNAPPRARNLRYPRTRALKYNPVHPRPRAPARVLGCSHFVFLHCFVKASIMFKSFSTTFNYRSWHLAAVVPFCFGWGADHCKGPKGPIIEKDA